MEEEHRAWSLLAVVDTPVGQLHHTFEGEPNHGKSISSGKGSAHCEVLESPIHVRLRGRMYHVVMNDARVECGEVGCWTGSVPRLYAKFSPYLIAQWRILDTYFIRSLNRIRRCSHLNPTNAVTRWNSADVSYNDKLSY
jgi:hypothetical protein